MPSIAPASCESVTGIFNEISKPESPNDLLRARLETLEASLTDFENFIDHLSNDNHFDPMTEKQLGHMHSLTLQAENSEAENLKSNKPIPGACNRDEPEFDVNVHVSAGFPEVRYTFNDLGLPTPPDATSPIAATGPFPLFTVPSIPIFRKALFNPSYISQTASNFNTHNLVLRNTGKFSKFFRDAFTNQTVMRAVSRAAGVELESVMGTVELGHANIQIDLTQFSGMDKEEMMLEISKKLKDIPVASNISVKRRSEDDVQKNIAESDDTVLPWHYDSYPWVTIVMLSDTAGMEGGETVIWKADGTCQPIFQPGKGSAMMLQGGLVKHMALQAQGSSIDRITLVTSYRAKAAGIYDTSFLSRWYLIDHNDVYHAWMTYRLAVLRNGIQGMKEQLEKHDEKAINTGKQLRQFVKLQKDYIQRTLRQVVPIELVISLLHRYEIQSLAVLITKYNDGSIFEGAGPCLRCPGGLTLSKTHLTLCPGAKEYAPEHPIWGDVRKRQEGMINGMLSDNERMYGKPDFTRAFKEYRKSGRTTWGFADECAVNSLPEYLAEYFEYFGLNVGIDASL